MENVVDAPTFDLVDDHVPAVTVILCVNELEARFVETVSVFDEFESVSVVGDAVHVDALGIVGSVILPLALMFKPSPVPLHIPLMESVPVPSALCVTVVDPVRTVSVVKLYVEDPLDVVHPVHEK